MPGIDKRAIYTLQPSRPLTVQSGCPQPALVEKKIHVKVRCRHEYVDGACGWSGLVRLHIDYDVGPRVMPYALLSAARVYW